jgi:hypothetical protein
VKYTRKHLYVNALDVHNGSNALEMFDFIIKQANCLSSAHWVVSCRLPQRYLRCRGFRHIAHDCKRPRHIGPWSSGVARASDHSDGATASAGTTATASGGRRRRRRRPRKRPRRRERSAGSATAPASTSVASDALPAVAAHAPPSATVGGARAVLPRARPAFGGDVRRRWPRRFGHPLRPDAGGAPSRRVRPELFC